MTMILSASASGRAYAILLDASNRPVGMMGRVSKKVTKGRSTPPVPISGFDTDYTPFDRGHIMALELNGPDISENIVPQYRHWQETGAWRKNEVALSEHPHAQDAIFVAELSYPGHPNTYVAQQQRFQQNEIFDWTDLRIPDAFDIWLVPATEATAKDIEKHLLSDSKATAKEFNEGVVAVRKLKPYARFVHSKMPEEDVAFWKSVQVGVAFHTVYETYKAKRKLDLEVMETELKKSPPMDKTSKVSKKLLSLKEEAEVLDVTRSPMRTDVEFAMTQGAPIKQELEKRFDWKPAETVALNNGLVVKAVFGDQKKSQTKAQAKRHVEYEQQYAQKKQDKDDYEKKGVSFKGHGYTGTSKY